MNERRCFLTYAAKKKAEHECGKNANVFVVKKEQLAEVLKNGYKIHVLKEDDTDALILSNMPKDFRRKLNTIVVPV